MFLRWLWFIVILVFTAPHASAEGTYWVGRDNQGVYLQTDQGKSWYIGRSDLKFFSIGEEGQYRVGSDSQGTYIQPGKSKKFYVEDIPATKTGQDLQVHPSAPTSVATKRHESRVALVGNQVLVPVKILSDTRKIEILMLLDTGAEMTVIHNDIAEKLKLKPFKKGYAQVVGGGMIPMALAKVKLMETGGIQKKGVNAGIIDYQGDKTPHKGLLGMDFLRGLRYRINYKKQTIQWEK